LLGRRCLFTGKALAKERATATREGTAGRDVALVHSCLLPWQCTLHEGVVASM